MADGKTPYAQAGTQPPSGPLANLLNYLAGKVQASGYWGQAPAGTAGGPSATQPVQQAVMPAAPPTPQAQNRVNMQIPSVPMTGWQYNLMLQKQYREDAKNNPDAYLQAYRHNENPKLKSDVETIPTLYPVNQVKPFLDAYKIAKNKYGVPDIGSDRLAAMLLAEGRPDFGYNNFDRNQKHLMDMYTQLRKEGFDDRAAGFATAIKEKADVAKRLEIPFEKAWTGTGKTKYNTTSSDYLKRIKNNKKALQNEKNKAAHDFIKQNAQLEDLLDDEIATAAKGGSVDKALKGGSKMI